MDFKLDLVQVTIPEDANVIIGQSHFIKTVEDIYECIVTTNPSLKFGIAFIEASGPRLIRFDGNDEELIKIAVENAQKIGAGHCFVIVLKEGFPINIKNQLQNVQEVIGIFAATANPLQIIIAESEQGRGILGVIDGFKPLGIENQKDIENREDFLRKITQYKR
ncbi:MAG: adenosine-specific kinase [Defluviitoga tunisiensis]|jgi:adenosine/AMP kinase|uniref:Adenosine specific kinase n=1 Tax=Defluviitoga tunisiensis TaxID=1006576 RepID=A0A0C7NNB5_DEFTU|nr:adenosine-specific kinase [Defluviitoga tunisiensis]CEP77412.1 Adenosine specific kinase [Defluviitoga tunisiensis]HOB55901.1 adenosine-specific kinase [Defluviitoga tunisiensis]HPZ67002.1 adenosine-specific kinase [Defluviitoga tunisiensis]HQD43805.1 adenosine-specific kinase [Defluviitoga tunisiensis]